MSRPEGVPIVACRVGPQRYALAMAAVASVQRAARVLTQPAGDGRIGILEGANVPIYQLADLLGTTGDEAGSSRHVLVLRGSTDAELWGVLVDDVSGAFAVAAERITPLPRLVDATRRMPLQGIVRLADGFAYLLDPTRLHPGMGGHSEAPTSQPAREPVPAAGPTNPTTTGQAVQVSVAGHALESARLPWVLLPLGLVDEVAPLPELVPAPGAPVHLLGMAAWRQRPVPVLDLGRVLGLPPFRTDPRGRLLVARSPRGMRFGFPVHASIRTLRLPLSAEPDDPPLGVFPELLRGSFRGEGQRLIVPDLDRILGER